MASVEKKIVYTGENKENCSDDAFCNCDLKSSVDLLCDCGEELDVHEWCWDEGSGGATLLSKGNREVRFHPGYSSGTAAVRGTMPFVQGHVYYWEIKMLTSLYGTDVMVGVGTKRAELDKSAYQFCSLLGSDKESWGFSYTGRLQHGGKTEWYGPPFGKGSIIGCYLDMWRGTLEFYLNRKPLGIAFRSLQGHGILYPMVCSTAAQSAMRVTYSASHPVTLRVMALQALDSASAAKLFRIPGLRSYASSSWWLVPGGWEDVRGGGWGRGRRKRGRACRFHPSGPDECPHQAAASGVRRLCLMCDIVL